MDCFFIVYPKAEISLVLRINANSVLGDVSAVNPHTHRSFRQDIYMKTSCTSVCDVLL